MAAKYYAVKNGRVPGIYTSWEQCREQVEGYSGADYKSFPKKSEANAYLGIAKSKQTEPPAPNTREASPLCAPVETVCAAAAYVDGSYSIETGEYAFGAVLILEDKLYTFSHKYSDPELAKMRNVAGEIAGASFALKYAVQLGLPSIEIIYDYEGIEKWATGKWKANLSGTREYVQLYRKLSDKIRVRFTKVKGHSGDVYNDMADRLAKNELGIK